MQLRNSYYYSMQTHEICFSLRTGGWKNVGRGNANPQHDIGSLDNSHYLLAAGQLQGLKEQQGRTAAGSADNFTKKINWFCYLFAPKTTDSTRKCKQ
jgi:hypothetical protein